MLTSLIVVPAVAALIVALVPSRRSELHLPLGFGLSVIPLAIAGVLFFEFETGSAAMQFTEHVPWYEPWGIAWSLGVDGISLGMIVLTTILIPISLAASTHIDQRVKEFVVFTLLLEAGLIGTFLATDLFLFFVFFEAVLVPMYFIIGIWGSERRIYAAVKFFLYTAFGSAFMLAAIIALGLIHASQTGAPSFELADLMSLEFSGSQERWLFAAFAIAFAIKVPLFPVHTWLPDAHVEAPTAGSVLLAGVMLKLGTYGLLRFNLGLFPQASVDFIPLMATLAVIGIVYGAIVAIVQPDLKKLVAYSSVSHLGFIVLGTFALTSAGLQGAVIQNINHGLTTGALFLLVGMLYERRHTKKIAEFGGLAKVMPIFAGVFLFTTFASIGLPGLNGFVGEFLVLIGTYPTLQVFAIIAASGVIFAAVYLLWAYERVFTGEPDREENKVLSDLSGREIAVLAPLVVLMVVLGLYPKILLDRTAASTEAVLDRIEAVTDYEVPEPGRLADVFVVAESEEGE
ncbi:MAG: NADH-quinone oxidoreductase subunit M [Acidimicrobiia bacterium]|nr:NADH-quinone oxidoreductase subunit M [Acidimicrobiia bacterium]MDH4308054.1 NADH-quinone oxidoreductase subunit M [Acidimicrobiia bacterium]